MLNFTLNIPEKYKDHPLFKERICGSNFGTEGQSDWRLFCTCRIFWYMV